MEMNACALARNRNPDCLLEGERTVDSSFACSSDVVNDAGQSVVRNYCSLFCAANASSQHKYTNTLLIEIKTKYLSAQSYDRCAKRQPRSVSEYFTA